jgi:hypothetical protein
MLVLLVIYLLSAVAVEAISEIITSSDITFGFRAWIKRLAYPEDPTKSSKFRKIIAWFDKLISCGYCTSVWIAAGISFAVPKPVDGVLGWVICIFVLHRISNLLHVIYELIKKGRVKTYDIMYQKSGDMEDGSI